MPALTLSGLKARTEWEKAGVSVPGFDIEAMRQRTAAGPQWVHFGAGNIFRGFMAACHQELLEAGTAQTGIVAVESFDEQIIDKIYAPHDNLVLNVAAGGDGKLSSQVLASIAEGLVGSPDRPADWKRLTEIFRSSSLQMASFTITEKGYSITDTAGAFLSIVQQDLDNGPARPVHVMARVTSLMWDRFRAGAAPVALVSMDNCSHNGEKLQTTVLAIARVWREKGFVDAAFEAYLADPRKVTFPWSMIDKITPRPSETIRDALAAQGAGTFDIVVTAKNTWISPFVNAESAQYLFVEDQFPNGRPPLEKSRGVWFATRDTVNKVETMKVTTCLNPLHTALSLTGSLLGHSLVFAAMGDATIAKLVHRIGYLEGLPVVVDPQVIRPIDFLDDVVKNRFVNPHIPDTTGRICSDTSMKVGIRYGETIKAYLKKDRASLDKLVGIPLVIAAWFRYLAAVDDAGQAFETSPDPRKAEVLAHLGENRLGGKAADLTALLANQAIFGTDLNAAGLGPRIQTMYAAMLQGPGAVRRTLEKYLDEAK